MFFKPFDPPKIFSREELQRRLLTIQELGFLPIFGKSRSADVGESLETYLGLNKNVSKKSDWGEYEIKTLTRKKITLFSFVWKFFNGYTASNLTKEFGKDHFSKHLQEPVIRLDWAIIYSDHEINGLHYTLDKQSSLLILRSEARKIGYLPLTELKNRFHKKLKNLVLISVEKKNLGGKYHFRITEATIYEKSSFDLFLAKLMNNEIKIVLALMLKNLDLDPPKLVNRGNLIRTQVSVLANIYEKKLFLT